MTFQNHSSFLAITKFNLIDLKKIILGFSSVLRWDKLKTTFGKLERVKKINLKKPLFKPEIRRDRLVANLTRPRQECSTILKPEMNFLEEF
jgi:hypothetical protein